MNKNNIKYEFYRLLSLDHSYDYKKYVHYFITVMFCDIIYTSDLEVENKKLLRNYEICNV